MYSENIKTETVFFKTKWNIEWNVKVYSEIIETEIVFIKTERSIKWNINFHQNAYSENIKTETIY